MKRNWEFKKLSEVCTFINGRAYSKQELLPAGKYPVLRVGNFFTNNHWYYSDLELNEDKYCDNGDLLYAWSASFGPKIWNGDKVIYHYHIWKVIPDTRLITKEFLYFLLQWDTEKIKADQGTGTTMMHVSKGSMDARLVPLPPLLEQQRIVSILDEAFAAITRAKSNAELNLKNAKKLFESCLQITLETGGENWTEEKLGNCFTLRSGEMLSNRMMSPGSFPVYGGNGISGMHEKFNLTGSNIVIGRVGALCGNVRHIEKEIWLTDNAFQVIDFKYEFDHKFLTYLLNYKNLRAAARQAAQPVISNSSLKHILLRFPKSPIEQKLIAQRFDAISIETQKLEAIYKEKQQGLEELKKSILQKAFNGELKTSEPIPA